MPCMIRLLTEDGLKPVDYTAGSLAEAAQYEPDDGVYTVTNTYETFKVLKLDAHLDRMEDSARRLEMSLHLDRARLRAALRQMISDANYGDVRFRVTAAKSMPDVFILSLEPFKPLADSLIQSGVWCVTAANSARQNAAAKTTDWMHNREAIKNAMPAEAYEAILLDAEGNLLEGLSSNFYAVLDGQLYTAGEGVLGGISRQIVFEIAPSIVQTPVTMRDLSRLQEAFITSSSRGIVPVVKIDEQVLGDGLPGARTMQLHAAYQAWVSVHLEEI